MMSKKNIDELREYLIQTLSNRVKNKHILFDEIDPKTLDKILFYETTSIKKPRFSLSEREIIVSEKRFYKCFTRKILQKIDFSNVSFDNFDAEGFDFTGLYGVKINPQTVLFKNLSDGIFDGVTFIGGFEGAYIYNSDFTGSSGALINPQTVLYKDLSKGIFNGVTFIGDFNENDHGINKVDVTGANFNGSSGAKIDLNKVDYSNDTNFTNVDLFDSSDVLKDKIKAKIDLKTQNKHLQHFKKRYQKIKR